MNNCRVLLADDEAAILEGYKLLFDWGKYYEKDGRIMIPISVQAHHSFVDGVHIGQFVEELKRLLNEC